MKLLVLLLSLSCFAGLKVGRYYGTFEGVSCHIDVKKIEFKNAIRSPFNEVVTVEWSVGDITQVFELEHPFSVNKETKIIVPIKSLLSDVIVSKEGNPTAMVLQMEHSEEYHGPTKFEIYINAKIFDQNVGTSFTCSELKFSSQNLEL